MRLLTNCLWFTVGVLLALLVPVNAYPLRAMEQEIDLNAQLLNNALDSYKEEYRELSEVWRNLDTKSQGVIVVDGIFLTGLFTFIQALSHDATYYEYEKWLLTISAVLSILSIGLAMGVLWTRTVPAAPVGESLKTLVDDLLGSGDGMTPETLHNFSRDHSRMWKSTNAEIHIVNNKKAKLLKCSQATVVLSIVAIVALTLVKLWR